MTIFGIFSFMSATIPLEQHNKEISSLKEEIAFLKEQIEWFKKQVFGQKADKFVDLKNEQQLQFEGFDKLVPVPSEEKQSIEAHERKKRKPNGQDKYSRRSQDMSQYRQNIS
jgi:transposase